MTESRIFYLNSSLCEVVGGAPACKHRLCAVSFLSVFFAKYSTGCPSSSGSCSILVPWSGGVSWVLLRPTSEIFAVPPRAPEVAVHSAHCNRGYSLFLLLVPPQPRPVR